MSKVYITTAIPFVNAKPHIGFALELVQGDVIARYNRLVGNETRFQTGTDENALKNVAAAEREEMTPKEFVDRNAGFYRELCTALDASPDSFVRTSESHHARAVEAFWRSLAPGDIYTESYTGHYCMGCEDFLLERDLVDGLCPDHLTAPTEVREENYFFRLSAYQERIERLIESGQVRVVPETRRNEVLSFVRQGLVDISVSRSAVRAGGWGIPVPGDDSQVVYVWVDALVNYISGLGYGSAPDWGGFWGSEAKKVHVIGKNVWKFHAVYWLAFLLSAGLPLPDEICVHGFLTVNGTKISKSLGNVIDPFECVDAFGTDGVRYYLLRGVSPFVDSDISVERLREVYNADLANSLGNLVSRLTTLCVKAGFQGVFVEESPEAPLGYHEALAGYEFDRAFDALWQIVDAVNREIQETEPWKLIKSGDAEVLNGHLTRWLRELYRFGFWLRPFLPGSAERILSAVTRSPVVRTEALFPRIMD